MKRLRMNPILKKEITIEARTFRFPLAVTLYALVITAISLLIVTAITGLGSVYNGIDFNSFAGSFVGLAYAQIGMSFLIMPILTAASIAGERERQTLDLMLTAPVSPFSIVFGKLCSALARILLFIISGIPAMSLCFLYGGIEWPSILVFLFCVFVVSFFTGAVGIWCSSVFRRTITSVIMSLIIEGAVFFLPLMVFFLTYALRWQYYVVNQLAVPTGGVPMGTLPLLLLLSPFMNMLELMLRVTNGVGFMDAASGYYFLPQMNTPKLITVIAPYWGWIGSVVTILLGVLFLFLATRQIDSVRRKGKTMKRRNRRTAQPAAGRG